MNSIQKQFPNERNVFSSVAWRVTFLLPLLAGLGVVLGYVASCFRSVDAKLASVVFPFVLAIVLFHGFRSQFAIGRRRQAFAVGCWLMGLLLTSAGGWLISANLYLFGYLWFILAWQLACTQQMRWTSAFGLCLIGCVCLPFIDELAEVASRFLTERSAKVLSLVLDGIGVLNYSNMDSIEVPSIAYSLPSNFWGFNGLSVMAAISLLLAYLLGRSLLHLVLSIFLLPFWTVIIHCVVGVVAIQFSDLLSGSVNGWKLDETIAVATLLLQILFVVLVDLLLARILQPVPQGMLHSDHPIVSKLLNSIMSWPRQIEDFTPSDALDAEANGLTVSDEPVDSLEDLENSESSKASWDWIGRDWLFVAALMPQIALSIGFQYFYLSESPPSIARNGTKSVQARLQEKDLLPSEIGGMRLTDTSSSSKNSDIESTKSWKFEDNHRIALVSLIYPIGQEDLWSDRNIGDECRVVKTTFSSDSFGRRALQEKAWGWVLFEGVGQLNERFYIFRCGLNEEFAIVRSSERTSITSKFKKRLQSNLLTKLRESSEQNSVIGIEVRFETASALSESDKEVCLHWFESVRDALRKGLQ